jgi:hypothetical protein
VGEGICHDRARALRNDRDLHRLYVELVEAGGPVAELGRRQARFWSDIVERLRDGELPGEWCSQGRTSGSALRDPIACPCA